jgi:undecaprenyl-diphosphatase
MIEDVMKAAILGIVQGLTEFLPVSSTAHLILSEEVLGIDEGRYGLAFDSSLHLGTLAALLLYFGSRWATLARAGLNAAIHRRFGDSEGRTAWLIVVGTVPAAVLGLVFESQIEDTLRAPALIASMLIVFSVLFVVAERVGKRRREISALNAVDAIVVGFAQAVALVPGVSRSGAAISAGLLRDVDRKDAATFAFLLSAPIVAAAGLRGGAGALLDFADGTLGRDDAAFFITGMICAAVVGYAAIAFLLRFLTTNSLIPFAIYRTALGITVFAVLIAQSV